MNYAALIELWKKSEITRRISQRGCLEWSTKGKDREGNESEIDASARGKSNPIMSFAFNCKSQITILSAQTKKRTNLDIFVANLCWKWPKF